jgi:hypothetical protein
MSVWQCHINYNVHWACECVVGHRMGLVGDWIGSDCQGVGGVTVIPMIH